VDAGVGGAAGDVGVGAQVEGLGRGFPGGGGPPGGKNYTGIFFPLRQSR